MCNIKRTRKYDYCINGMLVQLVNCPIPGNHRHLATTAEAWAEYALRVYGKGIVCFTIMWDEYGCVSHRVEYKESELREGGNGK